MPGEEMTGKKGSEVGFKAQIDEQGGEVFGEDG